MMRGSNVRFSTFESSCDAKQSNNVRIVTVKILPDDQVVSLCFQSIACFKSTLPCIRPVDSDFIDLRWIITEIFDMT